MFCVIKNEVGTAAFFLHRHLRLQPLEGLRSIQTIAPHQTPDLILAGSVHHNNGIHPILIPGFKQERNVQGDNPSMTPDKLTEALGDTRMNDLLKLMSLSWICKHNLS